MRDVSVKETGAQIYLYENYTDEYIICIAVKNRDEGLCERNGYRELSL